MGPLAAVTRVCTLLARPDVLRVICVAGAAATVGITWPLWGAHPTPPVVPLIAFPPVHFGLPLLASLAAALRWPRAGVAVYALVLALACVADQTRLQPQLLSFGLLILGTAHGESWRCIARVHLLALWFFAGTHKLLSPEFLFSGGRWMMDGYWLQAPAWLRDQAGLFIAAVEATLPLVALVPRARWPAAVTGAGLHALILLNLSPIGHDWNASVWPWNACLCAASIGLIGSWREARWRYFADQPSAARAAMATLALMPIGFHFGVVDAYVAHNLYAQNVPVPLVCRADGTLVDDPWFDPSMTRLAVPTPPEARIYRGLLKRACPESRWALIRDPRPYARLAKSTFEIVRCPRSPAPPRTVRHELTIEAMDAYARIVSAGNASRIAIVAGRDLFLSSIRSRAPPVHVRLASAPDDLSFSRDARVLVAWGHGRASLVDSRSGLERTSFAVDADVGRVQPTFSFDSRWIAYEWQRTVMVRRLSDGKVVARWPSRGSFASDSIDWSLDGEELLWLDERGRITLWRWRLEKTPRTIGRAAAGSLVYFSDDVSLAVLGRTSATILRRSNGQLERRARIVPPPTARGSTELWEATLTDTGELLVTGVVSQELPNQRLGRAFVWTEGAGSRWIGAATPEPSLALHLESRVLAVSTADETAVYDVATGRRLETPPCGLALVSEENEFSIREAGRTDPVWTVSLVEETDSME